MAYDLDVPPALLERQKWFGKAISEPLNDNHKLNKISSNGDNLEKESEKYLLPSNTLSTHQRIEIYHQQYWWRILKVMHQNFPTLVRYLSLGRFDSEISIPFLLKHPPEDYALCKLGQKLPEWLGEHYQNRENEKLKEIALIDCAAQKAFWSKSYSLPTQLPENFLSLKVSIQPYISLFKLKYDLFSFRELLLKENSSYWLAHPFPNLELRDCYFIVFRSPQNVTSWKEITYGEYRLLSLIREKQNIQSACQTIEKEDDEAYEQACNLSPLWFKQWIELGWLFFI